MVLLVISFWDCGDVPNVAILAAVFALLDPRNGLAAGKYMPRSRQVAGGKKAGGKEIDGKRKKTEEMHKTIQFSWGLVWR